MQKGHKLLGLALGAAAIFAAGCAPVRAADQEIHPFRYICVTPEDYTLLAQVVMGEAGCSLEPQENRIGVAEVILNRVLSPNWPNNVEAVIKQPGQFSAYPSCLQKTPTEDCYKAIDDALMGENLPLNENVYFFSASPNGRTIYAKIGGHYFTY